MKPDRKVEKVVPESKQEIVFTPSVPIDERVIALIATLNNNLLAKIADLELRLKSRGIL